MTPLPDLTDAEADALVLAGAAWLDEHAPADWRSRVDSDRLVMEEGCLCVCGQVFNEAAEQVEALSGYTYANDLAGQWDAEGGYVRDSGTWAQARGFVPRPRVTPPTDDGYEDYYDYDERSNREWRVLEAAWRRLLFPTPAPA